MIEIAVNADCAEHGVRFASGAMHVEAAGDEAVDYVLDLGVGGSLLHYDYHVLAGFPFAGLKTSHYKNSDRPS